MRDVTRVIAEPDEVPSECGVMVLVDDKLVVARNAPKRASAQLPFAVWMALAKATPVPGLDSESMSLVGNSLNLF